jgi:hypothetical protein
MPSSCYVDATKATSQKRVLELRLTQRGDGLDQALKTSKSGETPDHFVFPRVVPTLGRQIVKSNLCSSIELKGQYGEIV